MKNYPELYFKNDIEWREWLHENHQSHTGVYLIFYTVSSEAESMRWEEAVKVALCYGWIDSTVKKLDDERRRQYFCPRKPKSVWSSVNKNYILELVKADLMHATGLQTINIAKTNGSWTALDDVENLVIPDELMQAFKRHKKAYDNFQGFARSYRKSYLYWLHQAKRPQTRAKRIDEIIRLATANIKSRDL